MLKEISIDQLQAGMYVHSIAKQNDKIKVTNTGMVKDDQVVAMMKQNGILRIVIDPEKSQSEQAQPADVGDSAQAKSVTKTVDFDSEIIKAKQLHDQGKTLQKRMMQSVAKGLPIDMEVSKTFSAQLVGSINRNPNALMCLTKIREKDSYLLEHSLNVSIILATFAKHLQLSQEDVLELAYAGFLHDLGKIKIPDHILHKPGKLTDQEMNIMRDHVYYGVRALEDMDIPQDILRTVAEHHERLDGYGYPNGSRGDEISHWGRMLCIVDTYDAITSDRCYKRGYSSRRALQILLKDAPQKFDLQLVQQFVKCVGIYPVGSLVKLSNEQIAMIVEQRDDKPLKPIVKVFYSARNNHYLPPKDVDLAMPGVQFDIENAVVAADFGIQFNRYFNESIAV